jgi:hypothetical protein
MRASKRSCRWGGRPTSSCSTTSLELSGRGARVTTPFRNTNGGEKDGMTTMTGDGAGGVEGDQRCCGGERDGARRGGDL